MWTARNKTVLLAACFAAAAGSAALANHGSGKVALVDDVVTGDFDEDGNLDVIAVNRGFDNLSLFLGDGAGGLTLATHIPVDTLPEDVDVADVNGDGHLDLAVASPWGWTMQVLLGDGDGGFIQYTKFDSDEAVRCVFGYFDDDEFVDLVVSHRGQFEGMDLLLGDGTGAFSLPIPITVVNGASALHAFDLDGDGDTDLAMTRKDPVANNSYLASVLYNDGFGNFTLGGDVIVGPNPGTIMAAHLNGDGVADLVVAGPPVRDPLGAAWVAVLMALDAGGYQRVQQENLGLGAAIKGRLGIADVTLDGRQDVVVTRVFEDDQGEETSSDVIIFSGLANGTLGTSFYLVAGHEPHSVVIADLNEDTVLDLAVTMRRGPTVAVYLGDGLGFFNPMIQYSTVDLCGAANLDCDADIDLYDFHFLPENMLGPGEPVLNCIIDGDFDGDMDMLDYAYIQNLFTGEP